MLVLGVYIILIREINELVVVFFLFGILVIFVSVFKILVIVFDGLDVFKNCIRGLLGIWNDDFIDDFMMFDGIVFVDDVVL